jgi:hypothetical protein
MLLQNAKDVNSTPRNTTFDCGLMMPKAKIKILNEVIATSLEEHPDAH